MCPCQHHKCMPGLFTQLCPRFAWRYTQCILTTNRPDISNASRPTHCAHNLAVLPSLRQFLVFQLSINLVAMISAAVGALYGGVPPLNVLQLLWVNMIM